MCLSRPKWSQGAPKINVVEIQCTETAEYILFRTHAAENMHPMKKN